MASKQVRPADMPMHKWLDCDHGPGHKDLLTYVTNRRMASERALSHRHEAWEAVDQHNQLLVDLDRYDDDDPMGKVKQRTVIPASLALEMTRTTMEMAQLTARDPAVELRGVGPEDIRNALVMEATMAYDHRETYYSLHIMQLCKDAERYGFAVIHERFEEERGVVVDPPQIRPGTLPEIQEQTVRAMFPQMFQPVRREGLKRQYVRYRPIEPRKYWTDPSYPIWDVQQAGWAGHREPIRLAYMKERQAEKKEGDYFNLKKVQDIAKQEQARLRADRTGSSNGEPIFDEWDATPLDIDRMVFRLNPRELGLDDVDREELWSIGCINDLAIVYCYRFPIWHGYKPYSVAEVNPDQHQFANAGSSEQCLGLQQFIDWAINAHQAHSVRRINGGIVSSPEILDESGFDDPTGRFNLTPFATKKALMGRLPSSEWFRQLEQPNTTADFMQDALTLNQWLQRTLGVSDAAQAMPTPTKRTLGEISMMVNAGNERVTQVCKVIDDTCLRSLFSRHIALRQQLTTMEMYIRITGDLAKKYGDERLWMTPNDLWGNFDYQPISSVRPMDPSRAMETWVQLASTFAQLGGIVPQLVQQIDWAGYLGEVARTAGIRNFDQYILPAQTEVVPDDEFAAMQANGQAVPPGEAAQMGMV